MPSSLYIHIPFCVKKCSYCDFLSFASVDNDIRSRYMDALCMEIESITEDKLKLKTIFVGGGTPSILNSSEIHMLGRSISKTFDLSELEEFSIEANPESVSLDKIKAWQDIGINRVSMGMQSSADDELKTLGRVHSWEVAKRAYDIFRQSGIKNVNIDLMFSLPNQSLKQWEHTVDSVIQLNPEHISAYSLIIEEDTEFFNTYENGFLNTPTQEQDRAMYHSLISKLNAAGYHQYEISNFAKQDMECKHNMVYWNADQYYGVGLGASGYIDRKRYSNYTNFDDYINAVKSGNFAIKTTELITDEDAQFEQIMLGLRLNRGVDIQNFKDKFGFFPYDKWRNEIDKWINAGGLIIEKHYLRLTDYGRDIANSIIIDFL